MSGGNVAVRNGADFEAKVDLLKYIKSKGKNVEVQEYIEPIKVGKRKTIYNKYGYKVAVDNKLFILGTKKEYGLYIKNKYNIVLKEELGSNIEPDTFLIDLEQKKSYVFEKKFMAVPGSVDEKIKEGEANQKEHKHIMEKNGEKWDVVYIYIANAWFLQKKYDKQFNFHYKDDENVWVYIETLPPLERLGMTSNLLGVKTTPSRNKSSLLDKVNGACINLINQTKKIEPVTRKNMIQNVLEDNKNYTYDELVKKAKRLRIL